MLTCTVHEPPSPPADRIDRAESLVFVKDGFAWLALLFAPFWLMAYRLWWPLAGYVLLSTLLQVAARTATLDPGWVGFAGFAINLLLALEADTLRRWSLERRGWRTIGTVTGKTAAECERRFFDAWLPGQPILASSPPPAAGTGWRRLGGLVGAR
jgi:hypothetical protein